MRLRKVFHKRLVPELLSRPMFQPLNRTLFRIAISGLGVGNYDDARRDEQRLLFRLRKILPPEATILDVGANTGQYARMARKAFARARITSFEPNPAAFAQLEEAAELLNLCAVPLACGSTPGQQSMFDRSTDAGSPYATLVPGVLERQGIEPVQFDIEVTTIDNFCEQRGLDEIDLLKIDVEGFERDVLEGAAGMIGRRRIRFLQLEFNEMAVLSHTTMHDITALLPGYRLHRLLYDGSLLPIDGQSRLLRNLFGYQNIVAIRDGADEG